MRHCCHSLPAAVRVFRLHLLGRHSRDWWARLVLKEFSGEERWEEVWNFLQGVFKSLQWWREPCVSRVGQRTLQRRCKWQLWLCKILVRSVSSFISNPASVTIYTLTTTCFVHTTYSEVRRNVLVHHHAWKCIVTAMYAHHRYGRYLAPRPAADITPKIDSK